ncbi:hypothetical protein, partial [Paraburkholderia sp. J41]|uniref:hypothetical protein n=1 Tax=Paraburkholderia sp. J41 TaxID=2805433 RepID=UPI002AC34E13
HRTDRCAHYSIGLWCCHGSSFRYQERAIGARVIQLAAVVMLIPVILILALEKILDGATPGTLIGGIVGYLLSGISEFDRSRNNEGQ